MSIKTISLLKIFFRKQDIADVLGLTRQAVQSTEVFTDSKKVKLLHKASKKRMKEIESAYQEIEDEFDTVKANERKAKTK